MIASSALRASASKQIPKNIASVVPRNGIVHRISSNKMSTIANARRMTTSTASRDKFTGKRTTLDVKIPAPSPEPEPEGAKIPYVPTFWSSESAATEVPDISSPTVLTVASSATHLGGGPTGPSATKIDATSQEVGEGAEALALRATALWGDLVKKVGSVTMPTSFKDASDALSRFVSTPEIKADTTPRSTGPRDLDEEERKGAWILFGIVAGGWLAGGIFAKNGTPKPKHAAHH